MAAIEAEAEPPDFLEKLDGKPEAYRNVATAEPPSFDVAFQFPQVANMPMTAADMIGRRPSDNVGSRDIEITRNQRNVQIAGEKCKRAAQFPGRCRRCHLKQLLVAIGSNYLP